MLRAHGPGPSAGQGRGGRPGPPHAGVEAARALAEQGEEAAGPGAVTHGSGLGGCLVFLAAAPLMRCPGGGLPRHARITSLAWLRSLARQLGESNRETTEDGAQTAGGPTKSSLVLERLLGCTKQRPRSAPKLNPCQSAREQRILRESRDDAPVMPAHAPPDPSPALAMCRAPAPRRPPPSASS